MEVSIKDILEIIGGAPSSNLDVFAKIKNATGLKTAGTGDITFALDEYIEDAKNSGATCIIISERITDFEKPHIKVKEPRYAFNLLLEKFMPKVTQPKGVSTKAHIGKNVTLGENVTILNFAYIDDFATIGDDTIIYPHVYVGQYAKVGKGATLHSGVSIREYCVIGDNNIIHDNTVIGSDGFGFITKEGKHIKVPQVGIALVEDDVEIGANVAIDRATTGTTKIGKGTKIDNLVHIGHNCQLGEDCLVVAQTGLAGSTIVGHHVTFAGQVGSKGHLKVGSNSVMAARTGIISDIPENSFYAGFPARPHKEWLKTKAYQGKIPELIKEIKELKKRLNELDKKEK